jgi:hypothetical protein
VVKRCDSQQPRQARCAERPECRSLRQFTTIDFRQAGVRREESGLASGLINTTRQMGGALGLAILATISTQRTHDLLLTGKPSALLTAQALTAGFARGLAVAAAFAVAAAVTALIVPPVQRVPAESPATTRQSVVASGE